MAAEIPSIEPTSFIAGNTVAWTKDLSDYPAGTWTLKYYLRGPGNFTITATASGTTHSVSVSATTSKTYPKGTYDWKAFVTGGSSERYEVGSGQFVVYPDPENDKSSYDTRTPAKQILDALMKAQLENAGRPEQRYSIEAAGRTHDFYSHADLIVAIEKWQGVVLQEEKARKIARGEGPGNRVLLRFK